MTADMPAAPAVSDLAFMNSLLKSPSFQPLDIVHPDI
jgi:hypothetical protein